MNSTGEATIPFSFCLHSKWRSTHFSHFIHFRVDPILNRLCDGIKKPWRLLLFVKLVEKHGRIPIYLNANLQNHHILALFKKCWPWSWKCYHIFKAYLGLGLYSKGFLWQCMEKKQVFRYEQQRHNSVLLTTIRPSFCFLALNIADLVLLVNNDVLISPRLEYAEQAIPRHKFCLFK